MITITGITTMITITTTTIMGMNIIIEEARW
jgi:hypothetical protein